MHLRVLDGDKGRSSGVHLAKRVNFGEGVLKSAWVALEPNNASVQEVEKGRMSYDKISSEISDVDGVALEVRGLVGYGGGLQIATHRRQLERVYE